MTWRDAWVLALRGVRRRFGRAILTVFAVALAAALLSSLLVAAGSARSRVLDQVSKGGPLAGIRVDAAAPDLSALDSDSPPRGDPRAIDDEARDRIAALPGVRSVLPIVVNPAEIVFPDPLVIDPPDGTAPLESVAVRPDERVFDRIVGVDLDRADDLPISVVSGRLPTSSAEIAVSLSYLREMELDRVDAPRVIGTEVGLGAPKVGIVDDDYVVTGRWSRATIVGVVAQEANKGMILAPLAAVRDARAWTLSGELPEWLDDGGSPYGALFVVADTLDEVGPVRERITEVGYSTSAPESLIENVKRYVHVVELVLGGIGSIALVIAALGIANAMLAAVRERRREIGVLKAIGARDRDVRRVFVLEAAVLGFVGGVIGVVGGWMIARALAAAVNRYLAEQRLEQIALGVPVRVLVGGVLGATLLAIVAGLAPAQRAARLPARQAMGDR